MSNKLKVAIVGCGDIADKRHIPGFLKLKNSVTVYGACDNNQELAKKISSKFNIPKTFSSLSEMLAKDPPDIIDVCTPPRVHAALVVEALEHGCHVIVEKPMAINQSECDTMIKAARTHNAKLSVVHNQLYYPVMVKARELVSRGFIGDFIGMRIFMSDPRDEMLMKQDYWVHKLPGGMIGETGPHAVYKSLAFIGNIKAVSVHTRKFLKHDWAPFDEFRIELEGEKGNSSILVSYPRNRRASTVDIIGTDGALYLDLASMLLVHQRKNQSMKPVPLASAALSTASQIAGNVFFNGWNVFRGNSLLGHDVIIKAFVDSIVNNSPTPSPGEEGRETIRVMELIVEKLRQQQTAK
jgi:predicted dehydrogenase